MRQGARGNARERIQPGEQARLVAQAMEHLTKGGGVLSGVLERTSKHFGCVVDVFNR